MSDPAPHVHPPRHVSSPLLTAGGVVLAIGALYFGRDIFIPFAVAVLLAFALTPLVNLLRGIKLPRVVAVLVAVALAFVLIGGVAYVVTRQLVELANNLPAYQTTITQKIRALQRSGSEPGVVEKVTTTIEDLSKELSGAEDQGGKPSAPASPVGVGAARGPVTVRLESPRPRPMEVIQTIIGPLLAPLATAGLVVIFVIFVLLEREDLRDRFIKLVGVGDLQKSTQAINDAAARVSRYLLMQLLVNLTYGVPIGIALYFIGVPNAALWGLLATVLRFIPYLGPFLAALFPIALAIAVDPGWTMLLWVVGLFVAAELISNNFVEPWLYGSSTGLSALAIIMAAIFWTTLWGPVGLFLATPLTVCLVVIGRYVPQLEFLGVLLGSDPVLAPEERLYQRLLAGNVEEAVDMAEDYVDQHSSHEFYDNVAIPALRLAENDRQRSATDTSYRRVVVDTAICVVREVDDHVREGQGEEATAPPARDADTPEPHRAAEVICLAGRTELDRAAAEMMAQVLAEHGIVARVLPPIAISQGALGQLDLAGVKVVCLSYLHPEPHVSARYICRRLRRRAPCLKLAVCWWNADPHLGPADTLAKQMAADAVFVSLAASIDQVRAWTQAAAPRTVLPPDSEQARAEALRQLGLQAGSERRFDAFAKGVAQTFDVPIALVALASEAHASEQAASEGAGHPDQDGQLPHYALDAHVMAAGDVLVMEDVAKDDRSADDPLALEKGIRFYAGAPLRTSTGVVIGVLCLIDTQPRAFSEPERERLRAKANELIAALEREPVATAP